MPRNIAINGTRLDGVRMLLEPCGNGTVSSLSYPLSQIRIARRGHTLSLVVPAYLAVELYRTGVLPQDNTLPVEVSVAGAARAWYLVSDVRYPNPSNDGPFGRVTFTFTRVPQGETRVGVHAIPKSHGGTTETGTYVTNIAHYLDDTGELAAEMPAPARKLASFLTLLIDGATGAFPAEDHDSGIRCRHGACRGSIQTSLLSATDEILWQCPACGHHGVISNWQETKWNRLKHSEHLE